LVNAIEKILLARLQQPHASKISSFIHSFDTKVATIDHQDTYQSYSSFTTAHKPASEYESLLISASKLRSRAIKAYEKREASEMALVGKLNSLRKFMIVTLFRQLLATRSMHTQLTSLQSDVEGIQTISFFVDCTNAALQRHQDANLLASLAQNGQCKCSGLDTLIL
jgi:hypothetical protein